MTIKEIQEQIITEFGNFDDWMDRYNHLIDMGKSCPLIDEKYKTKSFLISGCQSRVWLHASMSDGEIIFTADSDAVITKGIVNLLIRVFSKQPADDIIAADIAFIDEIGLNEHLSPTRSNGLMSMIKQMKLYALAFKTKAANQ
ncbi:MAG: SufE family protein [Bacteroidetes bacterium]|nr:SufE family protein [Bacteroidota bacterium]MCK5766312.1 SufE family protein [Bacteroidales bacterium]